MRHSTILLVTALLACAPTLVAQQNPFAPIGREAPLLTLTKGQYPEVFTNDTLRIVCGMVYNRVTKKVVGFVDVDTVFSESGLKPELMSRWLSMDPLAGKYPFASPYNFALNNPIYFVDPDGRMIKPFGNALGLMDFRQYIKEQIGLTSVGEYLQRSLKEMTIGTGQSTSIEYSGFGLNSDASQSDFNRLVIRAVRSGEISADQARAAQAIFGALGDKEIVEVGVWSQGMHVNASDSERKHVTNNADIKIGVAKYVHGLGNSDPVEVADGIKDATDNEVKYSPNQATWPGEAPIEAIMDKYGNEVQVKGHVGVAPGTTQSETNSRITQGLIEVTGTP